MHQFETIVPLAVLFGVGWFLIILLRRSMRENSETEAWREAVPAPAVALPKPARPMVVVAVKPAKVEPIEIKTAAPIKPVRLLAAPIKTPVHEVIALLQDKDALVKAFLLREILGSPAALRGRRV